jgi:hypothetical protein
MFRSVALTLGDAFNRRKKLAADLQNWINRLGLAGAERRSYRTAELEGDRGDRTARPRRRGDHRAGVLS